MPVFDMKLRRKSFKCPHCGSADVRAYPQRQRVIRALPNGWAACLLHVTVHKLYCPKCGEHAYERLGVLTSPKARITRQLERTLLELRKPMSIKALSEHYGVPWQAIKDAEKAALGRKCARVKLKNVHALGIDEIYVFRSAKSHEKYVTVVRDMETGAVLAVVRGKGVDALKAFSRRIRRYAAQIWFVCMTCPTPMLGARGTTSMSSGSVLQEPRKMETRVAAAVAPWLRSPPWMQAAHPWGRRPAAHRQFAGPSGLACTATVADYTRAWQVKDNSIEQASDHRSFFCFLTEHPSAMFAVASFKPNSNSTQTHTCRIGPRRLPCAKSF
ncbi:MAG: hypothetical protein ACOX5G_00750 [Kiritimatiellia bacterium]